MTKEELRRGWKTVGDLLMMSSAQRTRSLAEALAAERAAGAREMRERAAAVARADGPDAWAYPEEHAAVEAAARAIEALPLGGATS